MKSLILAAGYATRLYPLTLNTAKPLLSVAGKPALEHIVARIEEIEEIEEIIIITNEKFIRQFQSWQKKFSSKKRIKILNDRTCSDKDRLGAVGDMDFAIREENIDDDLLVIAGDNLFELSLRGFIEFAKHRIPASTIGLYNLKDKDAVKRYSQVRLDANDKIIEFVEKPQQPTTTLVAKCVYFFPKSKLSLISNYLASGGGTDAPGYYINWLCQQDIVYGFTFCGKWYDIGNYEIYHKADQDFKSLISPDG